MLDRHRDRLDWWLVPLARALRGVHPDVFTWLSLVAAAVGGVAFARSGPGALGLLLLGWAMVLANSVLDLLDGKVAKLTGKASPRGDYLDHAVDRFSDVLFLAGLTLSAWVDVRIGLLAIVFTLLTSYLGTQAQAVGIGRNYGGLLGRADRMVLLLAVPLAEWLLQRREPGFTMEPFAAVGWDEPFTLLGLMLLYFAAVGALTTVQRFVFGLRAFDRRTGRPRA